MVGKEDMMKAIWPDTFVEEANLSRNIFYCARRWAKVRKIIATCLPRQRCSGRLN